MRVLIVEDDKRIAENIEFYLNKHGFVTSRCHTGEDALYQLKVEGYDVVILDWMLPDTKGPVLIVQLRELGINIPIMLLTAKNQLEDKVEGLGAGADDYLTKPFEMEELLARVKSLLRRNENNDRNPIIKIMDLEVNTNTCQVKRGGDEIELSPKLYSILEYLLLHKDEVISRMELLEHVWGDDGNTLSNTVDVHIRYLRQKLDEQYPSKLIKTIKGKGYIICSN
jgi:DNA-binding response OmpR family regulator